MLTKTFYFDYSLYNSIFLGRKENSNMIFKNRRSELQIAYELINLANKKECKKTHLMYRTNLSYVHFIKYLNFLTTKGMIAEKQNNSEGRIYYVTDKGKKFIDEFKNVLDLIE